MLERICFPKMPRRGGEKDVASLNRQMSSICCAFPELDLVAAKKRESHRSVGVNKIGGGYSQGMSMTVSRVGDALVEYRAMPSICCAMVADSACDADRSESKTYGSKTYGYRVSWYGDFEASTHMSNTP